MKAQELKTKIECTANNIIDTYFGESTVIDKMTNATLKAILKANMTKMDNILEMFTDVNGDIDAESLITSYANSIEESMTINIKDYVKSDLIKGFLPNKVLIITKGDIMKIIRKENPPILQRFNVQQ